jgi:hypothetical protein
MPEPPPVHISIDRRRMPRPDNLHCVGGPLNGRRLRVWPVEREVPLRHGRYERYPVADDALRNVLDLEPNEGEVLVWQRVSAGCEVDATA